ncbi:MAG: hypothetical protein JOZ17_25760 [Acetobacteraceae bacterium]|nr:hypothetical protein [Acetobacteraceae bacterium]
MEHKQRGSGTNHLQHAGTDTADWHAGVQRDAQSAFKPAEITVTPSAIE